MALLSRIVYLLLACLFLILALTLPYWYCKDVNERHLHSFCAGYNKSNSVFRDIVDNRDANQRQNNRQPRSGHYYNRRQTPRPPQNGVDDDNYYYVGKENYIYRLVFGFLVAALVLAAIGFLQDLLAYLIDYGKADRLCLILRNAFLILAALAGVIGLLIYTAHTRTWSILLATFGVAMLVGEALRIGLSSRYDCEP
ncbi:hypothetical protein Ciccas_006248 [Cichlidogyrus casuarinus]|uniref:Uncharacterized protein n=1 Tax=Cichlidogyrus casuarinus TaxID=1844966 RepID=A0ABD2Q6B5_9PLAT